ncbi:MAG: hypothetical protein M3461_00845 [Pseudomonadota bacterium]|nr:hypothetical protein [Pseudomonadota bacterium]
MQRLPPRSFLEGNTLMLRTGERVDRDALYERLIRGGYRAVSQVIEHGDYARPDCQRIALKNYRR